MLGHIISTWQGTWFKAVLSPRKGPTSTTSVTKTYTGERTSSHTGFDLWVRSKCAFVCWERYSYELTSLVPTEHTPLQALRPLSVISEALYRKSKLLRCKERNKHSAVRTICTNEKQNYKSTEKARHWPKVSHLVQICSVTVVKAQGQNSLHSSPNINWSPLQPRELSRDTLQTGRCSLRVQKNERLTSPICLPPTA